MSSGRLQGPGGLYRLLLSRFGPQGWWPLTPSGGELPEYEPRRPFPRTERGMFEVAVGAILTQNTAWSNVEKALAALARERALDPGRIASLPLQRLEALIRPSGYFSQKADRLRRFARRVRSRGGMGALLRGPLPRVREGVLALYGVGPETADSILLYAGGRPVFVVDAYTLRIAARLGWRLGRGYEGARTFFEARLPRSPAVFAEFHALLVRFAKLYCRARPLCRSCPALSGCPTGRRRALG